MSLDTDTAPGDVPAPGSDRPGPRLSLDNPRFRRVADVLTIVGGCYIALQWLWPTPLGVIVQGIIVGGLTALIAFGLALIFQANRIINFAQGDLGALPAALGVLLIVGPGVPYVLAIGAALASAVVLGALVEALVIRRFFRASRLILTVATIGVSQVLAAGALLLPQAFDLEVPPQSYPSPFDVSFRIDPIVFSGNDVLAIVVIGLSIASITAFLRFTNVGVAVRASAESADRASLLGIPVGRLHTIIWVIATLLATMAMLLRAGVVGLPIGTVFGPGIFLRALGAALIGRERLGMIFVASAGLGIVEQAVFWSTGRAILVDPIVAGVILVVLLVQRGVASGRVESSFAALGRAAREIRRIPKELAHLPEVRWGIRGLHVVGVTLLVALPIVISESALNLVGAIIIFGIVGLSLLVLVGWAGQISLGQMAFVGMGAAVAGSLTSRFGWDVLLSVATAGLAGATMAIVVGLPALRLPGMFYAVTTFAVALATSSYLLNQGIFDWLPSGLVTREPVFGMIPIASETSFYYLTLLGLLGAAASVRSVRNSRTGRVIIGVRENEQTVQAFGVSPARAKLTAFGFSGFLAGSAGGLLVHHQQGLGSALFEPGASLQVFAMVVIGGVGSISGVLLGATYVRGVQWFLPNELAFLASGAGLLLVLLIVRGGLSGVLYGVRDWILRRVAERRGLLVPTLMADGRAETVRARAREKEDWWASETASFHLDPDQPGTGSGEASVVDKESRS